MSNRVTIIDYGMCNMLNVSRAFEAVGAEVTVTKSAAEALAAERLVVPGVGAFGECVSALQRRGFDDAIRAIIGKERPILGICVGMQMLFEGSEEFGASEGLGILPGRVHLIRRRPSTASRRGFRMSVGPKWSPRRSAAAGTTRSSRRSKASGPPSISCIVSLPNPPIRAMHLPNATTAAIAYSAAVKRGNLTATQFHPERSGKLGLTLLEHFMST